MTILSALQSAAIRLVSQRPTVFFGSSNTFELELTDMANEVAKDVAQYTDWNALTKVATLAGNGTTAEFDLPDDFDRFLLTGAIQDPVNWVFGYRHYLDLNTFLLDESRNWNAAPGGWIVYGDKLRFSPAPTGSARFPYITKNIVLGENTSPKEEFTADTDTFRLPERLLTLGLVWRWRENKKLDASGDQEAFIKALDEYAAKQDGPVVIRRNSMRGLGNTHPAYPYELGPANYWPIG